jgi:hypothetical protein
MTPIMTKAPTPQPTTKAPTKSPSLSPTLAPVTKAPAMVLTKSPTLPPTLAPVTKAPADMLTKSPISMPPSPAPITKAPTKTKAPTPSPTKAPKETQAPTPNPTEKAGGPANEEPPSLSPSAVPTTVVSLSPSSLTATMAPQQSKSNLVSKSYQTVITVKLFGLVHTIPLDEMNAVEQLTQEFIQETMPAVKSVLMEVSNVVLSEQALTTSDSSLRRRRRSLQQDTDSSNQITLLTFEVDGEGWSTNEEILDALHFDDLARHGFLTRYDEYIARLQASSSTFADLDDEPADDEPPILTPPSPSTSPSDNSQRRSTVVVSVLAASFGTALLAGIICTVMVFGRRRLDTDDETESVSNDKADGSMDVEYTGDQEDLLFDDSIPRVISPATRKYPTQEQRGNFAPLSEAFECCSSLQSPSMDSIDVDQWSLVSVSRAANKNTNADDDDDDVWSLQTWNLLTRAMRNNIGIHEQQQLQQQESIDNDDAQQFQ